MRRPVLIRASQLRVGDVVAVFRAVFGVQAVMVGRGRVSVITDEGYPVDFDRAEIVQVLR